VFQLYVSQYGLVVKTLFLTNKDTNFLQVLRLAAHWIQLWFYLLLADQREFIVTGCNRMLTVV
jgi:hypothetical protein